ncbi:MAG: DNA-binding protein, partial [Clostridia bacterium]|nr:DNA-binding protein [Clostridia bacterium]
MKTLSKIELSVLCDTYGQLLTDKQLNALRLYCDFDYSLAEIA